MGNVFKGIRIKYLDSNFLKKKWSITENWCMFFTYRGKGRQRCRPSLACNGEELDAAQGIHVVSVSVLGSANAFIQNCGSRKTARILKHYCSSFQSHWSEYYNGRKKGTDAEGKVRWHTCDARHTAWLSGLPSQGLTHIIVQQQPKNRNRVYFLCTTHFLT